MWKVCAHPSCTLPGKWQYCRSTWEVRVCTKPPRGCWQSHVTSEGERNGLPSSLWREHSFPTEWVEMSAPTISRVKLSQHVDQVPVAQRSAALRAWPSVYLPLLPRKSALPKGNGVSLSPSPMCTHDRTVGVRGKPISGTRINHETE